MGETDAEADTLATWGKEPTHWKTPWCWERLKAGEGDDRKRCLDSIIDLMDMSLSQLRKMVKDREACRSAVYGVEKSKTRLSDWTTATTYIASQAASGEETQ